MTKELRFIVVFCLITAMEGSMALSEGEERAISDLFQEWPFLGGLYPPWTSNSSEACNAPFKGLNCTTGPDQHILSLNLQAVSDSGHIPESIGDLSWLQTLILEVERLTRSLPDSIGNLMNLQFLKVKVHRKLKSLLPEALCSLSNLTRLEIILEGYMGEFPEGILGMKKLEHLLLAAYEFGDYPSFYGSIPAPFCDLKDLKSIEFHSTILSGLEICSGKLPKLEVLSLVKAPNMSLPLRSLLTGRPQLKVFDIRGAPIFGSLDLDDQTNLESIVISGTNMSGTLPHSLWKNKNLTELILAKAKLGGTLSTSIGGLTQLVTILIGDTLISGTIPPEIGLCKLLHTFEAYETGLSGTMPAEMGNLPNLEVLDFSETFIVGTLPNSFNKLFSLSRLFLKNCNLEGTIPLGLLSLPNLSKVVLTQGRLSGTIPDEVSPACATLELDSNLLEGLIPPSALLHCYSVSISQNHLSGPIGNILINSKLDNLYAWGNRLSGSLPNIFANTPSMSFTLAHNQLSGTIPGHYRTIGFSGFDVSFNQLEGEISLLFENEELDQLVLQHNRFSGTIPDSFSNSSLFEVYLSNNFLTGTIPPIPPQLTTLSASANLFHGTLQNVFKQPNSLTHVDLSHNLLEGPPPPISAMKSLHFLSLASNHLSGSLSDISRFETLQDLQVLDLSNNHLEGPFPIDVEFLLLSNLLLANNSFSGSLDLVSLTRLSVLDISFNQFSFDASALSANSYARLISAQHNQIYGSLQLQGLPSLMYADFSQNRITNVDFVSLDQLSQVGSLFSVSIKGNPAIVTIPAFNQMIRDRTLAMSPSMATSTEHQGIVCSDLLIGNSTKTQFIYDESTFLFQQCQCDEHHFGVPPDRCLSCDSVKTGSAKCKGNLVHIEPNYYIYNDSNSLQTELCVSPSLYAIKRDQPYRISNCLGLMIEFATNMTKVVGMEPHNIALSKNDGSSIFPSISQLALQCQAGSYGRQCSRCSCSESTVDSTCYFPGPAGICQKCELVFSPKEYIPISLAILIVVLSIMCIIFYLVLASKRRLKELEWKQLSAGKRFVHCVIDLVSFGEITIMVTFVQIMVELTHWDVYALRYWLKLLNGESEGLGLRCLYPFLSNPTALLVLRLLLPMMVIVIACASIGLGELIYRFLLRNTPCSVSSSESSFEDDLSSSQTVLINAQIRERKRIPFSALALATSTSISIIKFFYFGTTMAAAEYLFHSVQTGTNKKFVKSVPWMSFEDARTLQTISIPFLAIYLFGIPFAFVALSWKLRHKILSPFVRFYFGTLFQNYQNHLFWWELINLVKKLSVSLLLRGFSDEDSLRPFFICSILGSIGFITASIKPWKRGIENFLDGIGSILLILSVGSNLLGSLTHSRQVRILIVAVNGIYILGCIISIVWRFFRDESSYEKEWNLQHGPESDSSIRLVSEDYGPPLLNDNDDLTIS